MILDDSVFGKSQVKFQEKLDREVLCHLPQSIRKFSPRYRGISESEPLTSSQGLLVDENYYFSDSEYYDEPTGLYAHFTFEESALSIIKSGLIRMCNLHNSNDENELSGASEQFNYDKEHINILKTQIFTLSLTKVIDEINDSTYQHHWEEYGNKKKGVALIFEVQNHPSAWKSFHFARIKYQRAKWFTPFSEAIHKWNDSNPHYYAHIPKLFSFHKAGKWAKEQEYRLLYNSAYDFNDNKPTPMNSIKGNALVGSDWVPQEFPLMKNFPVKNPETYFLELPLYRTDFSTIENNYFEFSPLIKIVGCVVGSKNDHPEKCYQELSNLIQLHLGYSLNDGF
jgi:hypothetical protein